MSLVSVGMLRRSSRWGFENERGNRTICRAGISYAQKIAINCFKMSPCASPGVMVGSLGHSGQWARVLLSASGFCPNRSNLQFHRALRLRTFTGLIYWLNCAAMHLQVAVMVGRSGNFSVFVEVACCSHISHASQIFELLWYTESTMQIYAESSTTHLFGLSHHQSSCFLNQFNQKELQTWVQVWKSEHQNRWAKNEHSLVASTCWNIQTHLRY